MAQRKSFLYSHAHGPNRLLSAQDKEKHSDVMHKIALSLAFTKSNPRICQPPGFSFFPLSYTHSLDFLVPSSFVLSFPENIFLDGKTRASPQPIQIRKLLCIVLGIRKLKYKKL